MVNIYYNTLSDYKNTNRFMDPIEGNNNMSYNSFLSTSYIDLYYKVNGRLQTISLGMADIVPLSSTGDKLIPNNFNLSKADINSVKLTYNPDTKTTNVQNLNG